MKIGLMTHDLTCTISDLCGAAVRYSREKLFTLSGMPRDLAVAAVAFTVQLAIDLTDRDPADLRALERDLIAKLGEAE